MHPGEGVLRPERVKRIYNGVDLDRLGPPGAAAHFLHKCSIPEDRVLVVQTCWVIPAKGVADLLSAAKRVISQNPRVHFAIVGEGNYREQYVRQTAEMGLSEHVTWTGLIDDVFEDGVYAAADLVCLVSRWEEAFGWVIAEGMAAGKPVVATRVGGIPELVADGETGFLVPRRDIDAIAQKTLRLVNDPLLRERMGRAGRLAAEAKFDQKRNVANPLKLYGMGDGDAASGPQEPGS